ncbi:MAG: glycoside hydrolase domain-containing protein [Nocardioidaceae bacterium]
MRAAVGAALMALVVGVVGTAGPAQAATVVTPGNFTGYGFDQCLAPSQAAMDAWLTSSPYWAVGIYISGDSRGCPNQPNLTPAWVATQLANGWRLLPITLGPQAWCTTRERYLHQVRIDPTPDNAYANARTQGRAEAARTVGVAEQLGIAAGSTLWYDIEAFDTSRTNCRESALSFLSAWTNKLHALGYVSGIYSSGASGIKMLDDARVNRPGTYAMPDQLWIADWNGQADASSTYVRSDGWTPHRRVHQYRGGHDETYGGVTINVDTSWVDLGTGSVAPRAPKHCGGVNLDYPDYPVLGVGATGDLVRAAQCLFREKAGYRGSVTGVFDDAFGLAVAKFRAAHGLGTRSAVTRRTWGVLHALGTAPLLKYGSAQAAVRRLQRALNALHGARLAVTGVFDDATTAAVRTYQTDHALDATGVVTPDLWALLQAGTR